MTLMKRHLPIIIQCHSASNEVI